MFREEEKMLGLNAWLYREGMRTLTLLPERGDRELLEWILGRAPDAMKPDLIVMLADRGLDDILPAVTPFLENGGTRLAALEAAGALGGPVEPRTAEERLAVARGKSRRGDRESVAALAEARDLAALSRYPREDFAKALKAGTRDDALLALLGDAAAKERLRKAEDLDATLLAADLGLDVGERLEAFRRKALERAVPALHRMYREPRSQYGRHCLGFVAFTLKRCGESVDLAPLKKQIPAYLKDNWGACPLAFALLALDPKADADDVTACREALLARRADRGGWDYSAIPSRSTIPWPFTLMPLLALDRVEGVPDAVWADALAWLQKSQQNDGSWLYLTEYANGWGVHTGAGVAMVALCAKRLGREADVSKAMAWLDANYVVGENPRAFGVFRNVPFQFLWAAGQAATAAGRRELGGLDWYARGLRHILRHQKADGSWADPTQSDTDAAWVTCLSVLYLHREFMVKR
jgi:hypothetical protein